MGFHQAAVDSVSVNLLPRVQAAAHTVRLDLLMDLIASQLIAPHASTKLNQTRGPIRELHRKSDSA